MSTNKTQNYNLHSWVPQDEFHVAEINENFAALDAAVGGKRGVLYGKYVGSARIELGVKPLAVVIMAITGDSDSYTYHGMAAQGFPCSNALILDESGFTIANTNTPYIRLSYSTIAYNYIAIY